MAMFSMKYNASGNYDGTAYTAMMDMAKPGEIWTSNIGKEFLILKNHGTFCSVLNLKDEQPRNMDGNIEVVSRQLRWTHPGMVGYLFNTTLGGYVKTIPEEEFQSIMRDVSERLGVTITVQKEEVPAPEMEAMQGRCHNAQARCDALYEAMEKMQAEHDDEVARLNANLRYNEESIDKMVATIQNRDKIIEELKAAGDPVGAVYKQLYHELLDRIIAGGGTK